MARIAIASSKSTITQLVMSDDDVGNDCWNKNVFSRWRKAEIDGELVMTGHGEAIMCSRRLRLQQETSPASLNS